MTSSPKASPVPCAKGDVSFAGAQDALVEFQRSLTASETSEMLGFSADVRARFGMVKVAAAASFARESARASTPRRRLMPRATGSRTRTSPGFELFMTDFGTVQR